MVDKCGCIWVDTETDSYQFHKERIVRARKEHRCDECGEVIGIGVQYEYVSGKWDGHFAQFRTCSVCLSIRDVFFCDGYAYGGLWVYFDEHLREMDGDISSECLVQLTPEARAVVCDRIEELWARQEDPDEEEQCKTIGY